MGRSHCDYQKLGLSPWYTSDKPPVAIRKLWVSRLVADFQEWHEQLATQHDGFYLAVWIFEPGFGESQLVAATGAKQAYYEGVFDKTLPIPLPREYHLLPGVDELRWAARAEIIPYRPDDFAALGAWGAKKPNWPVLSEAGEPLVAVQTGVVWVGRRA